jgi:hypothetical protein
MAKDDFPEAERGSSRLARKFGLLARALERMDELCNARCASSCYRYVTEWSRLPR